MLTFFRGVNFVLISKIFSLLYLWINYYTIGSINLDVDIFKRDLKKRQICQTIVVINCQRENGRGQKMCIICRHRSSSRHVFTNFPNTNLRIFSSKYYAIFVLTFSKVQTWERMSLMTLMTNEEFVFVFNWEILVKKFVDSILLTSSKNQIYEFRIPNISCCLNENLTTFLNTLSLTEATRKQSVYISRMLLKK